MTLDVRSPDFRINPYPAFRRLRAEAPVCRITPHGSWAVARHADVLSILRNPKLFSSSGIGTKAAEGPELLVQSRSVIGEDPPRHTTLRAIISKAFTPVTIRELEPRVRAICRELIQAILTKESFDLVADFSMPLPIIVISELLGIDPKRRGDFKRWSDTLITWRNLKGTELQRDTRQMFDYFSGIIAERRRSPKADLVSALLEACDTEQKLTSEEVLSFIRLLLVAGNETTTNLIGNTLLALLRHRDQWELVKRDHSLVPSLIEESLRFDSPAIALARRVTGATEIAGVKLAEGEIVLALLASANHDEVVFSDPESFDIRRDAQGHLAFGAGIHFCLGAPLARLQARVAFEELANAFDDFERVDSGEPARVESFFFRGVKQLKLAFRPRML